MKKITICFFLLSLFIINAQTKVAGTYHVSSGNPDDGGYHWMLFENHNFAMVTFGQIIAGKWSIDDKNVISFTPSTPKFPFDVYGRYDSALKGTKIMFDNFDINAKTYIGDTDQGVQPILGENANCLPYPLLKEFNKDFKDLVLSVTMFDQTKETFYVAENKKYNDFIIMYYSSATRLRPFTARLKGGQLYFRDDNRPSSPRKDISPKELKEMGKFVSEGVSAVSKEFIISNKAYNIESYGPGERSADLDEEAYLKYNYNYNDAKEIYTAKEPNAVSEDDAYHDLNTLYKYRRIELKPNQNSYKKIEKSIFNITCKD
ncbi:hypothetical protein [Chryseobacterium sp. ISL-6]|uniref:hypothetical protein n=1 Tax=Chryseobacterium sp. ISL-6 TaxID=2819143 RepID=UPI001BEA01F3|nr:hypothetical protein [Chryseobacterium sp. ISL-6]MBT2621669.1 hypothetical protein [Chryseobacterium sp. ISL-6]